MAFFSTTWQVAKDALSQFMEHNAMQLGAALAFYAMFSLAPILMIIIAVTGFVWGQDAIEGEIVEQVEDAVGEEGAEMIQTIIRGASDVGQGVVAIILGSIATILGATGVFAQLKASLNVIWGVQPKPGQAIMTIVRDRLLSFLMVLAIGLLLMLSLLASSFVAGVAGYADQALPVPGWLITIARLLVALAIIALLFAIIFKYLPDIKVRWRDVWVGAAITAVLFVIGESLVSLYLTFASPGSSYGAAGALVIVLMWVYYSSLIFLLGAEITQVYTNRVGEGAAPSDRAMPADEPTD